MNQCGNCGTNLDPNSASGLCPKCLLGAAKGGAEYSPTQAASPAPNIQPPKPAEIEVLFPELEVLDIVGQGGMGFVYKARQKNLGRIIALKLLSTSLMDDPQFAERFSREARAMAMMNHPNIIAIYDFGKRGAYYFLVMEFVDGLNLRQLIQTTKMEPSEAMQLVPQLCDALQYAHDRGIVHRDIKPENVLLSQDGRVKIADFGLAKLTDGTNANFTLTQTQQVMGTLNYMAPEQRERPNEVDHRADIYSLGVVIYELLTGELPLGRFAPPSKKVGVDVRLDEVVLRALEKEPELRFQQASEFKTGFETLSGQAAMMGLVSRPAGNKSLQFKLIKFAIATVALILCISGLVMLIVSAENPSYLPEHIGRPLAFVVAGIGGFLFAIYGFYTAIFGEPKPESTTSKSAPALNTPEKVAKSLGETANTPATPKTIASIIVHATATIFWLGAAILFVGSSSWGGDVISDKIGRFCAISCAIVAIFLGSIARQFQDAKRK